MNVPLAISRTYFFKLYISNFPCFLFDKLYSFENGNASIGTTADVIHRTFFGVLNEVPKCTDEIVCVYLVSDLFSFIAEYRVRFFFFDTFCEVGEKSMLLRALMLSACYTSRSERCGEHAEIVSIFLHIQICGSLRTPE